MNDLLNKDYARKVDPEEQRPSVTPWYLPHHPVSHPHKPDKVRVVFDCSAKHEHTSLNDKLLRGPDMTNSLVGVLTRFREERIAMTSDIEAMFHQVRVRPSDCSALRFLWWPNGELDKPIEEYEMRVHLFGGTSSPSCANFALQRTAEDNKADFDPETVETVKKNFYVDDCLKSVKSDDQAVRMASQLRQLLAKGGFRLTKWNSTSRKVIESLPESERAERIKDLNFNNPLIERVLGVQWNVSTDRFGFSIVVKDRPLTRRGILSVVSSVFDPLGFVAPFILRAKQILQGLCWMKLDWDEPIPDNLQLRWQSWLQELPSLEELAIDRCFKDKDKEAVSAQLHHFADASQEGYGAVTYLRVEDNQGEIKCSFVMGKVRVAPMKSVTIPRMELSAAVTAVKLDKLLRAELSLPVKESSFWTDSTCVLKYLHNQDKRFQTFVANRVAVIQESTSLKQWHYVNTEDNPADDACRGASAESLRRWIYGPTFLSQPVSAWPQRPDGINLEVACTDPEVKRDSNTFACKTSDVDPFSTVINQCSSWREQQLNDESLNTLFCEVEAIVNSRPITKLSSDPRDNEPLTPNHLLLLCAGSRVPPGVFGKEDMYSRRRWRQVQHLANVFWRRWLKEYLPSLQQRQKWNTPQRNFAVNDIVLIIDENRPRNNWALGCVIEAYPNAGDKLVRSVKLKTSTNELVRPVDNIVLLEGD